MCPFGKIQDRRKNASDMPRPCGMGPADTVVLGGWRFLMSEVTLYALTIGALSPKAGSSRTLALTD